MKNITFFIIVLTMCFITGVINAYAQKLPNKQEGSVKAPADIKIDGNPTEWDNHFQAYNKATEVYYTIANDDNNLYLIVQATNRSIINKIMNGGITFSVIAPGKKAKDPMSITFPVFERNTKPGFGIGKTEVEHGSASKTNYPDSVVFTSNKRLIEKSKLIMVTGIKDVDTVISVYNTDGIKAAQLFDNKMAYTYELSVSLKQLGIGIAIPEKFTYHITLNGVSILPATNSKVAEKAGMLPIAGVSISSGSDNLIATKLMLEGQSSAPTDFWGEYTLMKSSSVY